MRQPRLSWLILAGLISQAAPTHAQVAAASAPFDLSVTVYRDPYRNEGGIELGYLGGFAFITETRRIALEPGDQQLRFEGVADGIDPASVIVTGLPSGVIEKNQDSLLLSPSALVAAAERDQGRVTLNRTDPATGRITQTPATLRAASEGVVFETADGIEALRCSGAPETFQFNSATTGLSAKPTLSVRTRVAQPVEAIVQISYLSSGFDWAADYVADRQDRKINLGAWITLANNNTVSFENARVQVVAGRLNRETGDVEPVAYAGPILTYCWPQGSTSDSVEPEPLEFAKSLTGGRDVVVVTANRVGAVQDAAMPVMAVTAEMAQQEDLGDLKLYRLPSRTSILSMQSKQVRMLEKQAIPVARLYEADFRANANTDYAPLTAILRTKNDKKSNLGIPLPAGRVSLFETTGRGQQANRLLAGQTTLRDLAIDEETEFRFNGGADVLARHVLESADVTSALRVLPAVRGITILGRALSQVNRIEVSNARPHPVEVELRLSLSAFQQVVTADRPVAQKNGRPIFRVTIPANSDLTVRYQTAPR